MRPPAQTIAWSRTELAMTAFASSLFALPGRRVRAPGEGAPAGYSLSVDRARGGRWLAADGQALWLSDDDGWTFEEVLPSPGLVRVRARRDGRSALLFGALGICEWDVEGGAIRPLASLADLWPLALLRRGRAWWLFGAELARAPSRGSGLPERSGSRSLLPAARGSGSPWRGPGVRGYVLASQDEGRSWRRLARRPGAAFLCGDFDRPGRVAALDAEGRLHLLLAGREGGSAASLGRPTPLAARARWLEWDGDGVGRVGGCDARGRERVFGTCDGGATWSALEACATFASSRGPRRRVRLSGGARLCVSEREAEITSAEGPPLRWSLPATCVELVRDSLGAGVLVLASGEVQSVEPESGPTRSPGATVRG